MVAGLEEREERCRLRGDPAGERHPSDSAFEVRHALLEDGDGRVHDPGVRVPVLLKVEVGRSRLGVLEHVAGRLEDRHRAGAGVGVGPLPGVELARLESELARLLGAVALAGHASSLRKRRMIGVCCASSSRKQSWPYGASITCSSTGLPSARSASSMSRDPDGGYSQSELNEISSVPRPDAFQRAGERAVAVFPREIEVGQRPRRVEVGVGVEALDERVRLVAEIALDLELGLGDRVADVVGELQSPAELVVERRGREVRDVADHPCHAHAGVRDVVDRRSGRPCHAGSRMIASRAIAFHATPWGCSACVLAIATTASTWSGIP